MKDDPPAARDVANALLREARHELAEHGVGGVSLRAVARRAGVSHASETPLRRPGGTADRGRRRLRAPDRGTAARRQRRHRRDRPDRRVGSAYLDFGIANPAVFELMFNPNEVHRDAPALVAARSESLGVLASAVDSAVDRADQVPGDRPADEVSLISWALVHGLVVLIHGGALQTITGTDAPANVARTLTEVSAMLRANPPNRGFGT